MDYLIQKNRGEHSPQKKQFNFKSFKQNTVCSLNSVEYFLNDFENLYKYVRLYKLLK